MLIIPHNISYTVAFLQNLCLSSKLYLAFLLSSGYLKAKEILYHKEMLDVGWFAMTASLISGN